MQIPIIYKDSILVVVNKPAGLNTHPTEGRDPTISDVASVLKRQLAIGYLGIHQRLDRETSGVLLFTLGQKGNKELAAAFDERLVDKTYIAIVYGHVTADELERRLAAELAKTGRRAAPLSRAKHGGGVGRWVGIDLPLAPDANDAERMVVAPPRDRLAQEAATRVRVVQSDRDARYTMLEVEPLSGRTHQIRVHLAHLGYPVVGDPLYDPQHRPAARLYLHAAKLQLTHPTTKEQLVVEAPLPLAFESLKRGLPELELIARSAPLPPPPPTLGRQGEPKRAMQFYRAGEYAFERADADTLVALFAAAADRRAPFAADPSDTSAYRLFNAAADGLPGITVDCFTPAPSLPDDLPPPLAAENGVASEQQAVLVLNLYNEASEEQEKTLLSALARSVQPQAVYLKRRPKSAANLSEDTGEFVAPTAPAMGKGPEQIAVRENGLTYLIRPGAGLSIGLFLDMRETRARVRGWAKGKSVLNCFAYTCPFGVAATAGGASRVLNVDLSDRYLDWGKQNYQANGFAVDDHDFLNGDVFDWLKRLVRRDERFDLVILDPPSFATARTSRFSASQNYGELARLATNVVSSGGTLLACTNHAGVNRRDFRKQVLTAVEQAGRQANVFGYYREPTLDYPTPGGEDGYLKMLAMELK